MPRLALASLALSCLLPALTVAQKAAGSTIWGTNGYVEYIVGNAPIVLSAPHGGYLKPANVRNRTYGVTNQDRRTQELARRLHRGLRDRFGRIPHLVISHLHRSKLDPNRSITEAAQGDKTAELAWTEYHGFIDQARVAVTSQWGSGQYFDLHGHGHPTNWVELGYVLPASDLDKSDSTLRTSRAVLRSSMRTLGSAPGVDFVTLLRGAKSLGDVLSKAGFRAVPSPRDPSPGALAYFRGGYSTRRHGSLLGGTIDGIQLEHPYSLRGDARTQAPYLKALVDGIDTQFKDFRKIDLARTRLLFLNSSKRWISEGGAAHTITVERSYADRAEDVDIEVSGSAQVGIDFTISPATLRFGIGQRSRTFQLRALADTKPEGLENIRLRLVGGPEVLASDNDEILIHDAAGRPKLELALPLDEVVSALGHSPDLSSKSRDAKLLPSVAGGPSIDASGKHLGAMRFDGVDDALEIRSLNWPELDDFSLSLWFRGVPRNQSGFQYLVSFGSFSRPNSLHVWFAESTKTLRTSLAYQNDIAATEPLDAQLDLLDGAWHHYVLVARRTGLSEVWVDGVRQAASYMGGDRFVSPGRLLLGQRETFDRTRAFGGSLDEVRLTSRAHSGSEVRALFTWQSGRRVDVGAGCPGSAGVPQLEARGSLDLGQELTFELARIPPRSVAAISLGISDQSWGALRLPATLGAFGAAGCAIRVSLDFPSGVLADANGRARSFLTPPLDPSLRGARIFTQALSIDAGANRLGMSFSNALELVFGGLR